MIGLYHEDIPLKDVVFFGFKAFENSSLQFFGSSAGMRWAMCVWAWDLSLEV